MRKHMTQAEIFRIQKLLRSGVTDMAEIQSEVFVHAECIQKVITKFNKQAGNGAVAEAVAKAPVAKPKRRRKKAGATAAVDPLS